MRFLALAAAIPCLIALAPAPAVAAQRCYQQPHGSPPRTTVVATDRVRVYERGRGRLEGTYWACWRRTGKVMRLGQSSLDNDLVGFRVAGRYVAYRDEAIERCCGDAIVDVRLVDVARRRLVHRWGYALYGTPQAGDARLAMRGQRLTARGSYAFMIGAYLSSSTRADDPDEPVFDVVVASPRRARVVDSGPDIDLRSFSATARTVRWRRAGESRSAPMP